MFSAVHPTTDIAKILRHVRFVPNAEVAILFDHLVGFDEQGLWHGGTESFCSLQIDDQFELAPPLSEMP